MLGLDHVMACPGAPVGEIRLPCSDITRLRSIRLVAGLHRYYAAIRLPERHLPSSLIRLVGHSRLSMTGVSCCEQGRQGLTGCFDDMMYSASGRATSANALYASCNPRHWARGQRLPTRDLPPLVIKPLPVRTSTGLFASHPAFQAVSAIGH